MTSLRRAFAPALGGILIVAGALHSQTANAEDPPHEQLWQSIEQALQPASPAEDAASHFEDLIAQRREVLRLARMYVSLYPGGPRRDDAIRAELAALFDIGTLSGGDYGELCERVDQYLAHPPSEAGLHEAAYRKIFCDRLRTAAIASSRPASDAVTQPDAELLSAYRQYVERYPNSLYVPRMCAVMFRDAELRQDAAAQRAIVARLESGFDQHRTTQQLVARLKLHESVGKPFSLQFTADNGALVDTAAWKGKTVHIVVWAGFSETARRGAEAIERYRSEHAGTVVVGVNLDESTERMRDACRDLGIDWPQFNDGLGWANRFVLEWGIRSIPCVFVVDSAGRLVGVANAIGEWRELVGSLPDGS